MTTTRAQFLSHIHTPFQNPRANQTSPTKSAFRIRWRELSKWDTFPAETQAYWDALGDSERNAVVNVRPDYWLDTQERLMDLAPTYSREPHLSSPFQLLYVGPHNRATHGASDDHALLTTHIPDSIVGQPDGSFAWNDNLVGIVEIKTFWNLTQRTIDEVLQDVASRDGEHHGRLAIEQAYGYLLHNSVAYGLITTINAFIFLSRSNGGLLKMTHLIPSTTQTPTVLQMLYYMSHLCAVTPSLVETHPDGRVIGVTKAPLDTSPAPQVPAPSIASSRSSTTLTPTPVLAAPRRSPRHQNTDSSELSRTNTPPTDITNGETNESDNFQLVIDVHAPGTYLGGKGYRGVLQTGEPVFAKLWDGWKYSGKETEKEVGIYMALRDLWGTTVPRLLIHGGWGFCHVIVLELVEGTMLSKVPIVTPMIEENVIAAFSMLHKRGICHGDIRAPNVLVKNDNSVVIIDFERSYVNANRMMVIEEEDEVRHMLNAARMKVRDPMTATEM